MENQEGPVTEWELDFIRHVNPSVLRKRLRDELEPLYSVGTLVEAIKADDLLCHILAYAWESTHAMALVCKRFYNSTKMPRYWVALAKHALKDRIPTKVLESVNFFYFAQDDEPAHLFLRQVLKKRKCLEKLFENGDTILFYSKRGASLRLMLCTEDVNDELPRYILEYAPNINGAYTFIFFNYLCRRKVVWTNSLTRSCYEYCEVYCPERNQTWYGQPGTRETTITREVLDYEEMLPNPRSLGVWV
ncbi:MAG: hypothetical protein ABIP54_04165 [Candidatus Andersenbacteria bacterium]